MLDILRKHTRSWTTKLVFTLIVLSFIFFFGYSRMQKGRQTGGPGVAAVVNGEKISYGKYRLTLENAREYYKTMFNDQVPDEIAAQLKSFALNDLINEELRVQLGKKLGISVSDKEIYDAISNDPNFQNKGAFDPNAYKNVFLPYFERRYGINYETLLKQGLLSQKTRDFLTEHIVVSEKEAKDEYEKQNTVWTFDRITIPNTPNEGATYDISTEDIADKVYAGIKSGAKLNKLINKYKLEKERIKDVSIDKRDKLIQTVGTEIFTTLFSLIKNNPMPQRPIRSGDNWYVFKLIDLKKPSEKDWGKDKDDFITNLTEAKKRDYAIQWQKTMIEGAKIEEYVMNTGK